MTGFASPNHTQTPNDLFDVLLAEIDSLAELKITLAVIRKTLGYHKKKDPISFTQLQKVTGLKSQAVQSGIEKAIARGTIEIVGKGARGVNIFALVMHDHFENQSSDHFENQSSSTLKIKVTKETSQNKETLSPSGDAGSKPKTERAANPLFDAVLWGSYGLRKAGDDKSIGAMIGKILKWLKEQDANITPARIEKFYADYELENPNAAAPRDLTKFKLWWLKFDAADDDDGDDPFAQTFANLT